MFLKPVLFRETRPATRGGSPPFDLLTENEYSPVSLTFNNKDSFSWDGGG
jgi:hypothetical protein